MKALCGFIGLIGGIILAINRMPIFGLLFWGCSILLRHYIDGCTEKKEYERRAREKREERARKEREEQEYIQQDIYERIKEAPKRTEPQISAHKDPKKFTKPYPSFNPHWDITKTAISNHDITDDKINSKEKTEEQERKKLLNALLNCVSNWHTHGHYNPIKHKWFIDYYPYYKYKDLATASMTTDWKLVWNFKNSDSISSREHLSALQRVIKLTENTLKSTFGNKVNQLTLVCLTASTRKDTKRRFEEFSKRICNDLGMNNAFEHIQIIEDAIPKHLGGNGKPKKQYDEWFFKNKYIILFDDVRTSGNSIEKEKCQLESLGAKIIGAITIAQTQS